MAIPTSWDQLKTYRLPPLIMDPYVTGSTSEAAYSAKEPPSPEMDPHFVTQDPTIVLRLTDAFVSGIESKPGMPFPTVNVTHYENHRISDERAVVTAFDRLLTGAIHPLVKSIREAYGEQRPILLCLPPQKRYFKEGCLLVINGKVPIGEKAGTKCMDAEGRAILSVQLQAPSVLVGSMATLAESRTLDAQKRAEDRDAVVIKLFLQMDSDGSRFGILYGAFCFLIAERVTDKHGHIGLAFSEPLQASSELPAGILDSPPPQQGHLLALLTTILCSDLQHFDIQPSTYNISPLDPTQTSRATDSRADGSHSVDNEGTSSNGVTGCGDELHHGREYHTNADAPEHGLKFVPMDELIEVIMLHPSVSAIPRVLRKISLVPAHGDGTSSSPDLPGELPRSSAVDSFLREEPCFSSSHIVKLPRLSLPADMPHAAHVTLNECVGRGAVGIVWRGHMTIGAQSTRVILKMVNEENTCCVIREAAIYAAVLSHGAASAVAPNFYGMYAMPDGAWSGLLLEDVGDACVDNGCRFEAMEFTEDMRREIYEALCVLHSAGITHGDVEPRNVVFASGGVKIIDYNMAELHDCPGSICPELDDAGVALM